MRDEALGAVHREMRKCEEEDFREVDDRSLISVIPQFTRIHTPDTKHNISSIMFGLRQLTIFCAAICLAVSTQVQAETTVASASRNLRVQHDILNANAGGVAVSAPAPVVAAQGTTSSRELETKNPGGILGPLYAAFPDLLRPLALLSDTIHNTNAAISGVQHTPDGIFQA